MSATMFLASWGFVANSTSSGIPSALRRSGSSSCSAGTQIRAPTMACPRGVAYVQYTVFTPFATRPAQPMYWRFTPAVAMPCF